MLKLFKLLFGALLALHFTNALPTPDDNVQNSMTNKEQLLKSAGDAYMEFFNYAIEKYRELFDKVLTLSDDEAAKEPELKATLWPFVDYISEINENHDRSRKSLLILFRECTELAERFDRGVPVDATKGEKLVAKYMNEALAQKTKFNVLMKYLGSLQFFANNVRKYLNSLSPEERKMERKLDMWYINWQRQHDWVKKNDNMMSFFELLDDTIDDRTRLTETIVRNLVMFLNAVILQRKDFYRSVAQDIGTEIANSNSDPNVNYALENIKGFVSRAEKLHNLKDEDVQLVEMLRLFGGAQDIKLRFKKMDLSDGEKKIAEIMNKHGEMDHEVREMLLTFAVTEEVLKDVEEHLETRQDEHQEQEKDLKNWYEAVQDEKDVDKKIMKLFGILGVLGRLS